LEGNKRHPRDFLHATRIKIKLRDEEGKIINETLKCKKQIMRLVGEMMVNSEARKDPTQAA
jgi:hypothetical protein